MLLDGDEPRNQHAAVAPERRSERWWRRLRPYVDLGLLVALVAVAAGIGHNSGDDSERPAAVSTTSRSAVEAAPTPAPYPLLIAPATAQPGEVVSVVAYRRRGLCADIELRLDGVRLDQRVTASIEAAHANWNSVLLTVRIPAASRQDTHELELVGAVPGRGRGGPRCGDREQRWGRIAIAPLVVGSPPG